MPCSSPIRSLRRPPAHRATHSLAFAGEPVGNPGIVSVERSLTPGGCVSRNLFVAALAALCLVGTAVAPAYAQVTSAAVVGTITDTSGAALPGATVTARNVETGFVRTVPTNESGAYRLDFLPIGTYVVEGTLSGFKTERRTGIVLSVNDTARVDAAMAVGGLTETVNVEAQSAD